MQKSTDLVRRNIRCSEAAVDGLFAGAAAGLVMAVYLTLTALLRGEGPVSLLNRFAPTQASGPLAGLLMHLAISGIYGLLFGMLMALASQVRSLEWFVRYTTISGVLYGLILFLVAWFTLLPASGSALLELSFIDLGLAHILYGAALGYLARRIGSHGSA
jgi:hypothetical protein